MPELTKRSILPLFDRLSSEELSDQDSGVLETMESLEGSIARELHRLFNTRSPLGLSDYLQAEGTVLEYGVPDFSFLSGQSATHLATLQKVLSLAITRYERRLIAPLVQVSPTQEKKNMARVLVTASARLGVEVRRIEFQMLHDTAGSTRNMP